MSNPPYPFIYHGVTPFVYLLLTDSTPLIYLVQTLIALFAPSFEYKSITELGSFPVSFTSTKYICLSFFWFYYRPKGQISIVFHILKLIKPLPFHIFISLSLKRHPSWAEPPPPVQAIIGSTPPPPPAVLIVFIFTNGANECHDNLYCAEP